MTATPSIHQSGHILDTNFGIDHLLLSSLQRYTFSTVMLPAMSRLQGRRAAGKARAAVGIS